MPTRSPSICGHAGCGRLVTTGPRCEIHKKMFGWYKYEQEQGNRHARGYGYKWEKLRIKILTRDNYLCVTCYSKNIMTPAKQVDHIVPKAHGGTDSLNNLQSLCVECHRYKTARESTA